MEDNREGASVSFTKIATKGPEVLIAGKNRKQKA